MFNSPGAAPLGYYPSQPRPIYNGGQAHPLGIIANPGIGDVHPLGIIADPGIGDVMPLGIIANPGHGDVHPLGIIADPGGGQVPGNPGQPPANNFARQLMMILLLVLSRRS